VTKDIPKNIVLVLVLIAVVVSVLSTIIVTQATYTVFSFPSDGSAEGSQTVQNPTAVVKLTVPYTPPNLATGQVILTVQD
jgi:hypothetical protein